MGNQHRKSRLKHIATLAALNVGCSCCTSLLSGQTVASSKAKVAGRICGTLRYMHTISNAMPNKTGGRGQIFLSSNKPRPYLCIYITNQEKTGSVIANMAKDCQTKAANSLQFSLKAVQSAGGLIPGM